MTVLNMHRVCRGNTSDYGALDPKLFDEILIFLKSHFRITTFDQLDDASEKSQLVISFDDGYKDFIDVVAQLLSKHKIRCNQNIIPSCVESGLPPLNVMAQDFTGSAPAILVSELNVPGFDMADPRRRGPRLSAFIKNRPQAEQSFLREVLIPQFYSWDEFKPTPMMTRDEVIQVGGLHEIGGHSYSHASMEYEVDAYLGSDVRQCQNYFKDILGKAMHVYAFPNGSARDDQVAIVMKAGVEHVLLVGEDFDSDSAVHNRFTFDASGSSEARFKALGGFAKVTI